MPAGEAGEHIGLACVYNGTRYNIRQVYAKGNLGKLLYRDVVYDLPGDNAYDPFVLRLPNGNLIGGWHTSDAGDIRIRRSTDGGARGLHAKSSTLATPPPSATATAR